MKKNNGGFSLIEVLVAIVILAAVVSPTCSALVMSHRLNAETDKLMKAQLAVSSAVETLMAEGIDTANNNYENRFEGVTVTVTQNGAYYNVVFVANADEDVRVETAIRAKGGSGT